MLFVVSLAVLLPIFLFMMLLIIGSYCLVAFVSYVPILLMRVFERKHQVVFSTAGRRMIVAGCILGGLLLSVALFQVSKPMYLSAAKLWCGIEGSLDGTGRVMSSCHSRYRWLED